MTSRTFPTGELQARSRERTRTALERGALEPLKTRTIRVDDAGVPFVVRVVEAIERKEEAAEDRPPDFNPFLPYDDELWVADVGEHHVALLNKYYVLEDHLLVVTREFEEQTAPLNLADFQAWLQCLREFPSFGFYNGGEIAGASQRHKHMQVVRLPLAEWADVPMEARFDELPFDHHLARFDGSFSPRSVLAAYRAGGQKLGVVGEDWTRPHNVLLTRQWMMLVPRESERYETMSVNALGFAGAMLVRDDDELQMLVDAGPMTAVISCAGTDE